MQKTNKALDKGLALLHVVTRSPLEGVKVGVDQWVGPEGWLRVVYPPTLFRDHAQYPSFAHCTSELAVIFGLYMSYYS